MKVRAPLGQDGESDFVLAIPDRGPLVLEVKGGTIKVDDGRWFQDGRTTCPACATNHLGSKAGSKRCTTCGARRGARSCRWARARSLPKRVASNSMVSNSTRSPSWASAATCFPARVTRWIQIGFCLRGRRFGSCKTSAMNVRSGVFFGVLAGALAAGETVASEAFALDCSTLPNPVYIQNGDTQEPLLKALGQKLRNAQANPVTLIYKNAGSCTNIDAMYKGTKLTTNPSYIPSQTEDPTWDSTKPSPQCTISPNGQALDLAISALFVSSCDPSKPPANIGLFQGPVQPYLFVVPEASSQKAITAEEAYFTFGFGAAGNVEPWTDESLLFIRPTTKSTLLTMAASIGVPAAKWKGVSKDTSSAVVTSVATSPTPEKTLGILGAELYDAQRATLNALAFQAYKQKHAYFPDSTATSFDKRNVRDGHYTIWSPTVYLAPVDGNGTIVNPRTRYVVDLILSKTVSPAPDFDPLATVIAKGLVPDCAMKVTRSFEAGDLSNEDGLYDRDPKKHADAKLISKITLRELLANMPEELILDRQLFSCWKDSRHVEEVQIVNGCKPGNLLRALAGEHVGTVITKESRHA